MSNSVQPPHGLQPARLLCPCDSPGKNTRVGCHALLQGILPTQGSNLSLLQLLYERQILYCWALGKLFHCLLVLVFCIKLFWQQREIKSKIMFFVFFLREGGRKETFFLGFLIVLVSLGCCNKMPHTGWLIYNRNFFLTVLEPESLRSGPKFEISTPNL